VAGDTCRHCGAYHAPDVVAEGAALGVSLSACGHNADWSIDAWHVHSGATPNTQSGDLYLLQDAEADGPDLYRLVRRYHSDDSDDDTLEELAEGDLEKALTTIKETTR
tara:strand:- start:447 stop:770 length:324 start_codon:yes stop_codon:yes gene_type:complete